MKINNTSFDYFKHNYNQTWTNERHIEVSLGIYFLNKFKFDCIEIGAVMPHYDYIAKLVIDPRDDYQNCYKINALDYSYFNENVLSISTIEHFKIDEFNRTDYDSITCLCKIINESKNYLITWPIGYNKILDNYIKSSNISRFIIKRKNVENEWEIDDDITNFNYIYNYPTKPISTAFPFATAICVVTNLTF